MASQKQALLEALRRQLNTEAVLGPESAVARLNVAAIDGALPWGGLPCGALHEVTGAAMDGAATGFCAMLLAQLSGGARSVLWIANDDDLYGPGLAAYGLSADRLIVVRARRPVEILWTLEEALRCRGLAAALGEVPDLSLAASRRLQLAARSSGVTALLLRQRAETSPVTTAVTRWRVTALPGYGAPGDDIGPRWCVELARCRGRSHGEEGYVERWLVEWHRATRRLGLVSELRDRPAVPEKRYLAR
jgi:protein ImuA